MSHATSQAPVRAALLWHAGGKGGTTHDMMTDTGPTTIAAFQRFIRERYYQTDSARGPARTFLWFTEEIGELAEALAKYERGDGDTDELAAEFADVLAWLTTLANITDVDLTEAVHAKYVNEGGPKGTK